jgi:hypothetical protein
MLNAAGLLLSVSLPIAAAENHIVPLAEMQKRVAVASHRRESNLGKANAFLSMSAVQQALRAGKMEPERVRQAISLLSDDELSRFVTRTDRVRTDLEAGALSNLELTYIVIALATAVIILVIVAA